MPPPASATMVRAVHRPEPGPDQQVTQEANTWQKKKELYLFLFFAKKTVKNGQPAANMGNKTASSTHTKFSIAALNAQTSFK